MVDTIGQVSFGIFAGTNRRFLSHALHPVGVTQYEDFLYWTDAVSRSIERAEKDTGSGHIVIQDDVNLPMDITVVHASRQAGMLPSFFVLVMMMMQRQYKNSSTCSLDD